MLATDVTLKFEDGFTCDLVDFIYANQDGLTVQDIQDLISMKVGEDITMHIDKIIRIK